VQIASADSTLNIISNNILQLEIMQVGQLSADAICTKQV
jgi:hypothetical protein